MTPGEARETLAGLAAQVPGSDGAVRLGFEGGVAWIRLDNPSAHNALTVGMMCDLAAAVDQIEAWDGAAVVLASAIPSMFCSGGHLRDVQQALLEPDVGRAMALAMGSVLDRLLAQPAVVVAAVDGPAIGGGAELLTACDLRVLSTGARVHFVHARLGVAPGWGGARRLVAHVGRGRALRILCEARSMDAGEAHAAGLADVVVTGPAPRAALDLLAPALDLPAEAVRAVKAQVVAAADPIAQADRFADVWGGAAHRAALEGLLSARRSTGR